jgi:hypothetical protein
MNKIKGIGGWLLIVLLDFIISGIINLNLLIQKITLLSAPNTKPLGVLISITLLLIYCTFIFISAFMILTKRKFAIKSFLVAAIAGTIFIIWYYLIAILIYYQHTFNQIFSNSLIVIINIAIVVLIAFYLFKSKRVKNTLVK